MPKRGENIYKRKDKRWEARLKTGIDTRGKPIYKSIYAQSYIDCKKKLKDLTPPIARPVERVIEEASLLFMDGCQQWLNNIKPTVKSSSFAVYYYIVERYIYGSFKKYKAIEINQPLVDSFIAELLETGTKNRQKGLSVKTVNCILITFRAICCFLERQYAIKNPLSYMKLPKQEKSSDTVLSAREWDQLASVLEVSADETATAIAIGLYTGMRIGELCALQKKDIDFNETVIHVQRTVQRIKNVDCAVDGKTRIIISKPKSAKSIRAIPIPDRLLERLLQLCDKKQDDAFILGVDGKKALEPRTLQYRFKAFLKKVKIRNVHFHALRHTFATRCVEKNMDIKTLSEILGHVNVNITLEKYVHSSIEFKRIQMNRLENVI